MRQKMKQLMGILLILVLVLVLMAGMSLTAYAATATYTELMNNKKVVQFNNYNWYIIEDNSTAGDVGTVTLLAADMRFGTSKFHDSSNAYSGSTVKSTLDALTEEGGSFAGVKDAIKDTDLTDVGVTGAKLYLLSTSEAGPYANFNFIGTKNGGWWLRSPGGREYLAAYVYGEDSRVFGFGHVVQEPFGVRPALQLDLSSVIFSSESNTFSLPITGVTLNPSTTQTVIMEDKVPFTASIEPDGALKKVKWNAGSAVKLYSDANCTTEVGPDATDKLIVYAKGMSVGTATVTVTATNGTDDTADDKSASCNVTVNPVTTYEVTYQVVGGTWSDGSKTDRNETVQSGSRPKNVPAGMKAASGYAGGSWDTDPTKTTITGTKTFIYTFTASAYSYTSGDGSTWPKNSGMPLSFRVMNSGDDSKTFTNFSRALVDGKPLTKGQQYEAPRGGVIIELKPAYLETLSVGEHTLTAEFTDGKAEAKFTVVEGTPVNLPQTGDGSNVFIHVLVGLLAIAGLSLMMRKRF